MLCFCCSSYNLSVFVMLIFLMYYMFISIFCMNIVYNQEDLSFYVINDTYYNISFIICLTSPALFLIVVHDLIRCYIERENQEIRIKDLIKTKKYLIEENTLLRRKYDLPVHLKTVCVQYLINKRESVCPICLEQIDIESNIYLTICGHLFHNDCIDGSINYSNKCPTCRKVIFYDNFE